MQTTTLQKYITAFTSLRQNKHYARGFAPHKPILLLAVLQGIECGLIQQNCIEVSPQLLLLFKNIWHELQPKGWHCAMLNPFRHLVSEGFWLPMRQYAKVTPEEWAAATVSFKRLQDEGYSVALEPELWNLLQDVVARNALRSALLHVYFPQQQSDIKLPKPDELLQKELQKLINHPGPFPRIQTQVHETRGDEAYLRSALFPRVIRSLYSEACSVCALSLRTETSSLVQAAHILPHSQFHNDHPCNGIALCQNHHWGFDRGVFTIDNQYNIIVCSSLQHRTDYVQHDSKLHLPYLPEYAPSPEALEWHRENVFHE